MLCVPLPSCRLWALRPSMFLIRNLVRTFQGGFLLTTPVVFETVVARDSPSKHVCIPSACSGLNWSGWAWLSSHRQGASWILAGPSLDSWGRKPLHKAGKTASLRPEFTEWHSRCQLPSSAEPWRGR